MVTFDKYGNAQLIMTERHEKKTRRVRETWAHKLGNVGLFMSHQP